MYPIEGSDVRDLARAIENLASSIKEESKLKENELATKAREIFALEKANELKEEELRILKDFKKSELEIYSREVFALEKANNLEEAKLNERNWYRQKA